MIRLIITLAVVASLAGCAPAGDGGDTAVESKPAVTINVEAPAPMPVPERMNPKSETDWPARTHNKEIEVIETINLINPVAVYLTEGFKLYGDKLSENLHEEWEDTQVQLTRATTTYDLCKKLKADGKLDKNLYLKLEDTWQLLVKTGVAGLRAKSMMDAEIQNI